MYLSASWNVTGIVTQLREVTSKKAKAYGAYFVRVASIGRTFELSATAVQFAALAEGQHASFYGSFDEYAGRQRLTILDIQEPPQEAS